MTKEFHFYVNKDNLERLLVDLEAVIECYGMPEDETTVKVSVVVPEWKLTFEME